MNGASPAMMLTVIALIAIALVAYWILLSRLATSLEAEKPDVYAVVGRPGGGDYMMAGLTVGDGYISKLEALKPELGDAPKTRSLMRAVRWIWASTFVLALAGMLVVLGT